MKNEILNLIKEKPRHYSVLIKRNGAMSKWVSENSIISSAYYPEMIYSALYHETNICKYGNIQNIHRISDGWIKCGPANICKCTSESISISVAKSKALVTKENQSIINSKRESTMIERFGVPFSLQREDVRKKLSKSKLSIENESLLNDRSWLHNEYISSQKSLTEIAKNLNVYYGTVGEYCKKYGFEIRRRARHSIEEKEICDYLETLHTPYIHSDWSVLDSKEIDVYIPSHTLGIELNGLYWHSFNPYCSHTPNIEDKNRHKNKTDLANKNGVNLIQITDYEWNNKQDIIKSIIKSKLGLSNKLYARNLSLSIVSRPLEKEFLNKNHLQGYVASSYAIGLYLNNELYSIMTFGKPRFSKNADIELLRLCTKLDFIVIGGSNKLFSEVRKQLLGKKLISYCDLSKFNGDIYKNLGFMKIKEDAPGYFWTDGNIMISRHKTYKAKLEKWLISYDSTKSQTENMFLSKYRRYWDCGQSSWMHQL